MILITENEVLAEATDFNENNNLISMGYGINEPEPKLNLVDVPGRNGLLDLTGALGEVTFENRNVWFSSLMIDPSENLTQKYSDMLNKYHGQRCKAVFDVDPEYYYEGRCTVSRKQIDKTYQILRFDLDADPLKYPVFTSDEEWLWNPFNFETGVIRKYNNIVINNTKTVEVIAYEHAESPKFYVTLNQGQTTMRMQYDGDTYCLSNGMNTFPQIVIQSLNVHTDIHEFTFTGYGKVSINLSGGIL